MTSLFCDPPPPIPLLAPPGCISVWTPRPETRRCSRPPEAAGGAAGRTRGRLTVFPRTARDALFDP